MDTKVGAGRCRGPLVRSTPGFAAVDLRRVLEVPRPEAAMLTLPAAVRGFVEAVELRRGFHGLAARIARSRRYVCVSQTAGWLQPHRMAARF
jgi:hypothetical protein